MKIKKKKLGIIFSKSPYGTSDSEEGLELLISLSEFFKNIYVFFIGDGIFQIVRNQNPKLILFRKYTNLFKMFKFLKIKKCFFSKNSLNNITLLNKKFYKKNIIKSKKFFFPILCLNEKKIKKKMCSCEYMLNF